MDREYLTWFWREIPREWKQSALICLFEIIYLLMQVWSVIHG